MQFRRKYYSHGGVGERDAPFSGVNQGFWSHLGFSGRNVTTFSRHGCLHRNKKNAVIFRFKLVSLGAKYSATLSVQSKLPNGYPRRLRTVIILLRDSKVAPYSFTTPRELRTQPLAICRNI